MKTEDRNEIVGKLNQFVGQYEHSNYSTTYVVNQLRLLIEQVEGQPSEGEEDHDLQEWYLT